MLAFENDVVRVHVKQYPYITTTGPERTDEARVARLMREDPR